jgi:CcmD family protein
MLNTLRMPLTLAIALLATLIPVGVIALASGAGPSATQAAAVAHENTNENTNLGYLFAIYIITWAGFFAYVFVMTRRQKTMENEVAALRALLDDQESAGRG